MENNPKVEEKTEKEVIYKDEEEKELVKKKKPSDDLRLRDSVILIIAFVVAYALWLILNAYVLNSEILPRLGFLIANGGFLAVMIIKMVKSITRKMQFYMAFHIACVAIVGAGLIGQLIILANL